MNLTLKAVETLYESFPYPKYPLFGQPRWQEGYLASSKFAGRILEDTTGVEAAINCSRGQFVKNGRNILVAGSGEALPYVLRKIEPSNHRLLCVDLSSKSLLRAKFRMRGFARRTDFIRSDIDRFLKQQAAVTGPYNHIDIYGVLHHLINPTQTLRSLSHHLSPKGTMRVMVYNADARRWIHELQSVFKILKIDAYSKTDRQFVRTTLDQASKSSPFLREKLAGMGKETINNDARLVDTFLHAREARLRIRQWFDAMSSCGLKTLAMIDRYCELDDLPNPLWKMPSIEDLEERCIDQRFENNLELYLCRSDVSAPSMRAYGYEFKPRFSESLSHYFRMPPKRWFQYDETASLSFMQKRRIWTEYIAHIHKYRESRIDAFVETLPEATAKRLGRIGAILPGQIQSPRLREELAAPIVQNPSRQEYLDKANFSVNDLAPLFERRLHQIGANRPELRLKLAIERLNRSQFIPEA